MWLAKVEDEKEQALKKAQRANFPQVRIGQSSSGNTSGHLSNTSNKGGTQASTYSSGAVKNLSPQEIHERREKGLCFHHNEKYTAEYRCKNQKTLCLEIVADMEEQEEPEEVLKKIQMLILHHQLSCLLMVRRE